MSRNPIRRLHPVEISCHLHAVDLMGPVERGVEGRHLVHSADKKIVFFMKAAHALHELTMSLHRFGDCHAAEIAPQFDLPHRFRFHLVAMSFKQRPERVPVMPRA